MAAIASLLTCLLMLATSVASSAEGPRLLVGNARGHSFSIGVPEGWVIVGMDGSGSVNGATLLFDLMPPDSKFGDRIRVAHYPNRVPITAQLQWERLTGRENVELPRLEDLPFWVVFGKNRGSQQHAIKNAYYSLDTGTLVISVSSEDDEIENLLLAVLRSFRDLGRTPTPASRN